MRIVKRQFRPSSCNTPTAPMASLIQGACSATLLRNRLWKASGGNYRPCSSTSILRRDQSTNPPNPNGSATFFNVDQGWSTIRSVNSQVTARSPPCGATPFYSFTYEMATARSSKTAPTAQPRTLSSAVSKRQRDDIAIIP